MNSKSVFEEKYNKLNTAQKEAVDTIYGPVMVIAGPGTGKTTLLTLRIANIILKTDTRPEQVLALTFTESGVKAMKDKLREIVGSDALKVNIFTYHSFAEQILRRYNDYFAEFNNFRFISEDDSITLFENIIDSGDFERIKSTFSPYFQIKNIIGYIKELKREFVTVEDLRKYIDNYELNLSNDPDNFSTRGKTKGEIKSAAVSKFKMVDKMRELANVYEEYETQKKSLKYYDFDDVINEVVNKVRANNELLSEISEEYQFVLADEHQDANRSQNSILDFFGVLDDAPNLLVVGDEKQAIFRFQGGTLENFIGFKDRYKNAKLITLGENYRSHQSILDYSHDLISKRADLLINKDNLSAKGESLGNGRIQFVSLYDKDSEYEFVGQTIKKILEGTPDETVAVIYRQNKEKEGVAKILDILQIPYASYSDNELFDDRYAQEFVTFIKAMTDFYDSQSMIKLLCSSVFNVPIEKIHKINREISHSGSNAIEVLKSQDDADIQSIVAKIMKLSEFGFKNNPVLLVEEFARETDYIKVSDPSVLNHKLSLLRAFADMSKQVVSKQEDANILSLNNFLDKAITYNMKVSIPRDTTESRVSLMTAHKSKGLEFDHVIIVNLTNADWGESKHRSNFIALDTLLSLQAEGSNLEDSRKLLYVAMTRAKRELILTYPKFKADGKENEESGFIGEIRSDIVERVDVDTKATLKFLENSIPKEKLLFFRELFTTSSFSVSAFNNYLECPNRYLFNNLLRFPFAQNLSLYVGDATHEALEDYGSLVLRKKEHGGEILFMLFKKFLEQKPIKEKDKKDVLKEYRDSLTSFPDNSGLIDEELLKVEYKLEHSYPFRYDGVDYEMQIRGYVDRVDQKTDGMYVIDFKTGKPKSRNQVAGLTESSDGNYLRQITFYKMIMEAMDKEVKINRGQISFVLLDDKDKKIYHEFELTDEMVSGVKTELDRVIGEIMSGEFLLKGCDDGECEYCKLRKMINI
jgi:DNA helicase II / ATP-dependent DNA helicase PcrA